MVHFLSFFLFSQILQWSDQSNFSWNCSYETRSVPIDWNYLIWRRTAIHSLPTYQEKCWEDVKKKIWMKFLFYLCMWYFWFLVVFWFFFIWELFGLLLSISICQMCHPTSNLFPDLEKSDDYWEMRWDDLGDEMRWDDLGDAS